MSIRKSVHTVHIKGRVINLNDGKMFEKVCREQIQEVAYIYRINDFGNLVGIKNPCDHLAYKYPYFYMLENKAYSGASLPLKAISDYQLQSMLDARKYKGILPYFLVWYIDKDVTRAIYVDVIAELRETNKKSIRYDYKDSRIINIEGTKKKKYFVYDWVKFFKEAANEEVNRSGRGQLSKARTVSTRNSRQIFIYNGRVHRKYKKCTRY